MSYAHSTLATFDHLLGTLAHLIGKAEASGQADILDAKLAEDMMPLGAQVKLTAFQVLNTLNRMADANLSLETADPANFAEAKAMVAKAQDAVKAANADTFPAADAPVDFDLPNGMEFALTAEAYVRDWALAQLYFHLTTFYAILRAQGIAIGKADFVPYMMKYIKQPAG